MQSELFLLNIQKNALNMVHRANASHIGSCLSIAHILTILYNEVLDIEKIKTVNSDRDRFILSKGHATAILYAAIAETGIIEKCELDTYCENGSRLLGHASHYVPGVELSTGSLGHGLPVGAGIAYGLFKRKFDSKVYVIVSDGEMDEGSNWEAILFAGHHRLHNLTLIIDYNKIQSLARVSDVLELEPFRSKLEAFNWHVVEIDGHSLKEIRDIFSIINKDRTQINKPIVILAHTIKGNGIPFMENNNMWHYKSPNMEQLKESFDYLNRK